VAPGDIPFIDHHRYQGTAWLPAVMGLELAAEAARALCHDATPYAIRRVTLKKAVRFIRDEPVTLRTQAHSNASSGGENRTVHVVVSAQAREQTWAFAEMDVVLSAHPEELRAEPARTERSDPSDAIILRRSDLYPSDALRFQQYGSTYQVLDELVIHPGANWGRGHMTVRTIETPTVLPLSLIDGLLQAYGVALSRELGRWCGPPLAIEELCWTSDAVRVADLRVTMEWDASAPDRYPIWRGYDPQNRLVLTMTGCACGGTGVKDLSERLPTWSALPSAPEDTLYPYLGSVLDEEPGRQLTVAQLLQPQEDALLRDHQFNRYVIVPAVYYMELAVEAAERLLGASTACELTDFHFRQAFSLVSEPKTMIVEAQVMGASEVAVRFFSRRSESLTLHAEGTVRHGDFEPLGKLPPVPGEHSRVAGRDDLYPRRFPNGPIFQVVETMRLAANHTSRSALHLRERPRAGCRLPITLLDGAFQVDSATRSGFDRPSGLPHAFVSLRWLPQVTQIDEVECLASTGNSSTDSPGRLVLVDPAATILLRLEGITLTPAFSSLWRA
jgi:hypothetical protein